MIKKLVIAFSILLLSACNSNVIQSVDTGNSDVTGGKIAVIDGCSVYRIKDGHDRYVYFVKCSNDGSTQTSYTRGCGKNCTETVNVPTYIKD